VKEQSVRLHVLAVLILAAAPVLAHESRPVHEDRDYCPDQPQSWYCQYERESYLAASLILDDDGFSGATVGYGSRGYFMEGIRYKGLSASYNSHDGTEVWGVRRDWSIYPYATWWGGLGPLLTFGLEYRTDDPYAGLGGFIGLGGQLRLWTEDHWHFAVNLEHDFGISSPSRNVLELVVGFAHPKLGSAPLP
jgi:hypothetical protein